MLFRSIDQKAAESDGIPSGCVEPPNIDYLKYFHIYRLYELSNKEHDSSKRRRQGLIFMDDSLVSIILPTYNRAGLISAALDSLLRQTYQKWECIIIDDGSTDDTVDVLKTYDDPRIVYVYQENRGVSAARNTGISRCKGDMIALLDSDDEWLPKKLEKQLSYMIEKGFEVCQTDRKSVV